MVAVSLLGRKNSLEKFIKLLVAFFDENGVLFISGGKSGVIYKVERRLSMGSIAEIRVEINAYTAFAASLHAPWDTQKIGNFLRTSGLDRIFHLEEEGLVPNTSIEPGVTITVPTAEPDVVLFRYSEKPSPDLLSDYHLSHEDESGNKIWRSPGGDSQITTDKYGNRLDTE